MSCLISPVLFIHSFRLLLQRLLKSSTTQRRSRHRTNTGPEFYAEAPQATASEELAQGPYVAVKAGGEPMTLRTKGVDSTKASPRPLFIVFRYSFVHSFIRSSFILHLFIAFFFMQ